MSRTSPGWLGAIFLLAVACEAEMSGLGAGGSGGPGEPGAGNFGTGGAAMNGGSAGATSVGGSGAGASGGTTGTGGSGPPLDCTGPRAAAVPLRLLTSSQYDNSVLDILEISGSSAAGFGTGLDDVAL